MNALTNECVNERMSDMLVECSI